MLRYAIILASHQEIPRRVTVLVTRKAYGKNCDTKCRWAPASSLTKLTSQIAVCEHFYTVGATREWPRPLRPAANLLSGGSWPAFKPSGSGPIGLLPLGILAVSGEQNQHGNLKRAVSSRNVRDAQGTTRDMPIFAGVCTAERR